MVGGSIIRSSCGVAGGSRAQILPATTGPTLIRQPRCRVVPPSASRSESHASSTPTSSRSLCVEDPHTSSPEKEDEGVKKKAQAWAVYSDHSIFGPPPSKEEAEAAVYALKLASSQFVGDEAISFTKNAFDQTPSLDEKVEEGTASGSDQRKPGQLAYVSKSVISQAQNKVLNALNLLRINPSVQSMVVSLSSDKAVWNAVMKNERVQELRKSFHADDYAKYAEYAARGSAALRSDDITAQILSWLFECAKAQVMQFIDDIISLVNKLFHSEGKEHDAAEIVSDVVRSSFMVSVMVFVVVVLKRIA